MGRSVVVVDVEVLAVHLPLLRASCRVVGSAERCRGDDCVALVIEGAAVPDAPQCVAEVTVVRGETCVQHTVRFKPVAQTDRGP